MKIDFSVPGLRTLDTPKFYRFWDLVEVEAEKRGCFFFSQCGDGHEAEDEEKEYSDMFGWLVPKEFYDDVDQHYRAMDESYISQHYDKYFVSMEWEKEGKLLIIYFR